MEISRFSSAPTASSPPAPSAPVASAAPRRSFVEVLGERAQSLERPNAAEARPVPTATGKHAAAALVEGAFRSEDRLDATIRAAQRGQTLSPGQLIALQAEVFRHSQVVEVVSRTVDKVVGGMKQVLGTQV